MLQRFCLVFLIFFTTQAHAEQKNNLSDRLSTLIQKTLSEKIADVEIRIPSLEKLAMTAAISSFQEIKSARVVEDRPNGTAVIELVGINSEGHEKSENIQTPYEAWKKVPVAIRRIYPNQKLKAEDFRVQDVNVASGIAREVRGAMISASTPLHQLQSRQSILENQYVLSNAVEKQPDLKKGDTVKLELVSGELTLVTQAIAEEPGSVGDRIRVMTVKTKREITGVIREDRSVEVNL